MIAPQDAQFLNHMQKQTRSLSSIDLRDYIESSNAFYQDLLGYKPEATELNFLSDSRWIDFCTQFSLKQNSLGAYLPRNQTALVRSQVESAPLTLFHEYFGHGLYCEQSLAGIKLVELEKRLLEEERQEFSGKLFGLEDVNRFRQQNKTFQEIQVQRVQDYSTYEGFAVFAEYILSRELNLKDMFGRKYDSWTKESREGIEKIIDFNRQYGDLATFYAYGLRKLLDSPWVLFLISQIFGDVNQIKLMMHFGSKKPFSDIDLFIISNNIHPLYSENWIDVRTYTLEDIEKSVLLLDPKVTDPIIIGEFIAGDKAYLDRIKRKIESEPITEDSIKFNFDKWKYHEKRSQDTQLSPQLRGKNLRSSQIYLANALAMKEGKKLLTSDSIKDYARKSLSHSESFIELKGGIN